MKIAIDITPMQNVHKTGIGYYCYNLASLIPDIYPENSYIYRGVNSYDIGPTFNKNSNVSIELNNNKSYKLRKAISAFIPISDSAFFTQEADISLYTNYYVPPGVKGKKVSVIHDMSYKAFPNTMGIARRAFLSLTLKKSFQRSDLIVTDSEFSKNEIIKYFGQIARPKIKVIYLGVDRSFSPRSAHEAAAVIKKYALPCEYILYLGTLEPRKNITRLIKSYHKALYANAAIPKFVIAGGKGWLYDKIFDTVRDLELENSVMFTGYIDEADKAALLSGAKFFVFPSLYEGFGLPVLEAMACGTPVITSNTTSLREIAEGPGLLVDPLSEESIYNAIIELNNNKELRDKMRQTGLIHAQQFSWEKTVSEMMDTFKQIFSKDDHGWK